MIRYLLTKCIKKNQTEVKSRKLEIVQANKHTGNLTNMLMDGNMDLRDNEKRLKVYKSDIKKESKKQLYKEKVWYKQRKTKIKN